MDASLHNDGEALRLAEASREEWEKPSFLKEIFMGNFNFSLISPFPESAKYDENFLRVYREYKEFLVNEVGPDQIDREGKIPDRIINRLREMKFFSLKIGKEYGGHGFTQREYNELLRLTATRDNNLTALLSAHQSIGVPQPLILFGNEFQKKKYLPRFTQGQVSAFALTESQVGSDPANMETTVAEEGDHYTLNGEKLWCTNGTIANVIIVMARHLDDGSISSFIVETEWPGVKVAHHCRFMGLRALENGVLSFKDVKIPKENLLWEKGKGLKLALMTLNTGRLSLPAAIVGGSKKVLEVARSWGRERVQWGRPIYQHEAIAQKLSDLAVNAFAMEAVSELATALYERHQDVRLEAAVAKMFCSESGWHGVDDLLQIRGGRGYETSDSLRERGEPGIPVERWFRDFRVNRIFEGTTEIMHLFIAREAVDKHLKIAAALLDTKKKWHQKLKSLPEVLAFYLSWYPGLWIPNFFAGPRLRYLRSASKKLARSIFHAMAKNGPRLQNKQALLFRFVDIATEIYTSAAVLSYSEIAEKNGRTGARDLAHLFCDNSRHRIRALFQDISLNMDEEKYKLAQRIGNGEFLWMEEGIVGLEDVPGQKSEIVSAHTLKARVKSECPDLFK